MSHSTADRVNLLGHIVYSVQNIAFYSELARLNLNFSKKNRSYLLIELLIKQAILTEKSFNTGVCNLSKRLKSSENRRN